MSREKVLIDLDEYHIFKKFNNNIVSYKELIEERLENSIRRNKDLKHSFICFLYGLICGSVPTFIVMYIFYLS